MDRVKVGFIGCGNHATVNLYPCLRFTEADLVAVADLWEEKREYNKRVFGAQRAYDDYKKMLDNEELDAVMVSGPFEFHHEVAMEAMSRGLHVFTEKPPAPNLAMVKEMAAKSRETGLYCVMAVMKRFGAKYRMAYEIANREEFGRKTNFFLRYSFCCDNEPEFLLNGFGIHAVDLTLHFMGDAEEVYVERRGLSKEIVNTTLNLKFKSGATGTVIMNNQSPAVLERMELVGENAMVIVDEVNVLEYFPPQGEGHAYKEPVKEVRRPNMALQTVENYSLAQQGYLGEVQQFIESVQTGTPPEFGTIEDGVKAMQILDIAKENDHGLFKIQVPGLNLK